MSMPLVTLFFQFPSYLKVLFTPHFLIQTTSKWCFFGPYSLTTWNFSLDKSGVFYFLMWNMFFEEYF